MMQLVEIEFSTGATARMQFGCTFPQSRLGAKEAFSNGFRREGKMWARKATDEMIDREIAGTRWADDLGTVVSWRRVTSHAEFKKRT